MTREPCRGFQFTLTSFACSPQQKYTNSNLRRQPRPLSNSSYKTMRLRAEYFQPFFLQCTQAQEIAPSASLSSWDECIFGSSSTESTHKGNHTLFPQRHQLRMCASMQSLFTVSASLKMYRMPLGRGRNSSRLSFAGVLSHRRP